MKMKITCEGTEGIDFPDLKKHGKSDIIAFEVAAADAMKRRLGLRQQDEITFNNTYKFVENKKHINTGSQ